MVVPGSGLVRAQAEEEGLADIFKEGRFRMASGGLFHVPCHEPRPTLAGRALRGNVEPQLRGPSGAAAVAPTLMSPAMAAAAAVTGRLTDVRELM